MGNLDWKVEYDGGMKTNEAKKLLTMKQFCEMNGVSRWTVYRLINEGKIRPVIGMGKGFRFTGGELGEVLERL